MAGLPRAARIVAALQLIASMPAAGAQERAGEPAPAQCALRVDNDFLAGTDAQYTSGLALACATSSTHAGDADSNHAFGLEQSIYTPEKNAQVGDRPYAATLTANWTYNRRERDTLSSFSVAGGMLGPSARGQQVQNGFHRVFGSDRRTGWNAQLADRALLDLGYDQLWRARSSAQHRFEWIYAAGASAGNLRDELRAGVLLRWSAQLPDDFSAAPLTGLGTWLAPRRGAPARVPTWYLFGRYAHTWYDAVLDLAPAQGPQRIDPLRQRWQAGAGVELVHGGWRIDAALVLAGREFHQQPGIARYVRVAVQRAR